MSECQTTEVNTEPVKPNHSLAEVGVLQDNCAARQPENWTGDDYDGPECMVDVIFNNEGVVRREYIAQRITILTCKCQIIEGGQE